MPRCSSATRSHDDEPPRRSAPSAMDPCGRSGRWPRPTPTCSRRRRRSELDERLALASPLRWRRRRRRPGEAAVRRGAAVVAVDPGLAVAAARCRNGDRGCGLPSGLPAGHRGQGRDGAVDAHDVRRAGRAGAQADRLPAPSTARNWTTVWPSPVTHARVAVAGVVQVTPLSVEERNW